MGNKIFVSRRSMGDGDGVSYLTITERFGGGDDGMVECAAS